MARVLIVEDDRPFADALAFAFRLEGYEVLDAATADEGVRLGLAHYPDLLLPTGCFAATYTAARSVSRSTPLARW